MVGRTSGEDVQQADGMQNSSLALEIKFGESSGLSWWLNFKGMVKLQKELGKIYERKGNQPWHCLTSRRKKQKIAVSWKDREEKAPRWNVWPNIATFCKEAG